MSLVENIKIFDDSIVQIVLSYLKWLQKSSLFLQLKSNCKNHFRYHIDFLRNKIFKKA